MAEIRSLASIRDKWAGQLARMLQMKLDKDYDAMLKPNHIYIDYEPNKDT